MTLIPQIVRRRSRGDQPGVFMSRMFLAVAIVISGTSCMNPRVQANMAQALNDLGSEMNAQRQDMALLQDQIDSLKQVTAKQDTVIKRLLNVTGLPPSLEPADASSSPRR